MLGQKNKPKKRQIIQKKNSKRRNAVSDSETNTIRELRDLKDSIKKNNPIKDRTCFLATTPSSTKKKRTIKKSFLNKPIRL